MTDTSILFQPTSISSLELKNRLAVAPMTRVSATEDGCATVSYTHLTLPTNREV